MTDTPSGRELIEKTFVYMSTLAKECRKALTSKFGQEHKGIPFDTVEPNMRKEIEAWFSQRDRNIKIRHDKSGLGRTGEVLMIYSGATKGAQFKFHIDGVFALAGPSNAAPSYLKSINVYVDKRDFTR